MQLTFPGITRDADGRLGASRFLEVLGNYYSAYRYGPGDLGRIHVCRRQTKYTKSRKSQKKIIKPIKVLKMKLRRVFITSQGCSKLLKFKILDH